MCLFISTSLKLPFLKVEVLNFHLKSLGELKFNSFGFFKSVNKMVLVILHYKSVKMRELFWKKIRYFVIRYIKEIIKTLK